MINKVNISQGLSQFKEYWQPRIAGELNQQHIKLVKFKGDFIWHEHENEDEMFLVIQGSFEMQFRDRVISIEAGEFLIVPRGVEHCPRAAEEVHVLLFEPAGTINTGDKQDERTLIDPRRI